MKVPLPRLSESGNPAACRVDDIEEDSIDRTRYNAVLNAVESIILAHACAGIKVDDLKYIEGIETTLEGGESPRQE